MAYRPMQRSVKNGLHMPTPVNACTKWYRRD